MAEYWKSTPNYWCKFCSTYVRDTKFERQKHEQTGRHQGNIQRSLRDIHRKKENEEREKERAKNEIARLNGIVPSTKGSASAAAAAGGDSRVGATPTFTKRPEKKESVEDRKRQLNELAAMGIAIPDQFRGDLALPGEWQVVSQRVIGEDEDNKPKHVGVHKRKLDEEEEEALAAEEMINKKKVWGDRVKQFPGSKGEVDFDALMGRKEAVKSEPEVKKEDDIKEESPEKGLADIPTKAEAAAMPAIKTEEDAPAPAVVFKKRKKIAK